MNIAFVFDGLGVGGIERVGVDYIKMLSNMGHQIDVYNLTPSQNTFRHQLPDNVKYFEKKFNHKLCPELYSYGIKKWWWGKYVYPVMHAVLTINLQLKKLFSKKEKYDYAIAFSGHINDLTLVANDFFKAEKKICWCHGSLASYLLIHDGYCRLYQNIDKIVTLSDIGQGEALFGNKMLKKLEIKKIYNPTFILDKKTDESEVKKLKNNFGRFVLMSARFEEPKDHKTALEAIKRLKDKGITVNLVFLGDGSKMGEITSYAKELGIQDRCFFEGYKENTADYNEACYISLLSSKSEGLPTVVVEAMSFGRPCVMTKCDGGEVSAGGKYACLVEVGDSATMAEEIEKLFTDEKYYSKYSQLAYERAKCFSTENIKKQLQELLIK